MQLGRGCGSSSPERPACEECPGITESLAHVFASREECRTNVSRDGTDPELRHLHLPHIRSLIGYGKRWDLTEGLVHGFPAWPRMEVGEAVKDDEHNGTQW